MEQTYTGRRVRIRSATGEWSETIARSEPFLNTDYVPWRRIEPWVVVTVDHAGFDWPVNWPLEDVELVEVVSR